MQENQCPTCNIKMVLTSPHHYHCTQCDLHYSEHSYCPICDNELQIIKGCGAINYLCSADGLVSSSKVKFRYLPE